MLGLAKQTFCLLNYLQERPPAVRSFCSDAHRKFRKCNFRSYPVRMGCVEPVVFSQGADSRFLGRVGAVQWSGLLCLGHGVEARPSPTQLGHLCSEGEVLVLRMF